MFEHIGLEGGQPGCRAYNEPAFRHFLAIERKRADRAGRSLLLMLVSLRPKDNGTDMFPADCARRVFEGLAFCVREVDFVGWYRDGRVAAAVLTQGARTPDPDIVHAIGMRVSEALEERLPWPLAARLDVRVLQLRPTVKE